MRGLPVYQQLWAKKSLAQENHTGLHRCLSAFDLTMLGIGAIIGTGLFVLTGQVAAEQSGPAVVLSFAVAAIACAFAGLAYAELAAMVGGTGSAYGYSYAAFGELPAWIIGWDLLLEYGVCVAAVAAGWSGYFSTALQSMGIHIPYEFLHGPFSGGILNLPAIGIIFLLMMLLIAGVRESARLNTAMVFVKIFTILVFIAVASFNVHFENWQDFMPYGWFAVEANGAKVGILAGASLVFFAYVGFDAVSTAVEEARDPKRDVPKGIVYSLIFCTLIYVLVSSLMTLVTHYTLLDVPSPMAFVLQQSGIHWAAALVATGIITSLTTVILVLFYGQTRILMGMAQDGLLPKYFAEVNEKTQTPVHNTIICGVVMMILAGVFPLGALVQLVNIGTLTAFVMVCVGVIVLRKTHPHANRPFVMPFGIVLPVLGIITCGSLIAFLPHITQIRFLGWLGLGVIIYFSYSIRHSKLKKLTA